MGCALSPSSSFGLGPQPNTNLICRKEKLFALDKAYHMPCFFLHPQLLLNQVEHFHSTTQLLSFLWVCAWWWWSCNYGIILFFTFIFWDLIFEMIHDSWLYCFLIVGLYHLLLFGFLSSRWFTIYSYLNCGINSLTF